jgi:hypothetical protein
MFDSLYGAAEHDDFMVGFEDMELRAARLEAEADAAKEAYYDDEIEADDVSTWTEAQERERYEAEVFQAQLDEDAYWAAKEAAHLAVEEYEAKEEANLAGSQDILF